MPVIQSEAKDLTRHAVPEIPRSARNDRVSSLATKLATVLGAVANALRPSLPAPLISRTPPPGDGPPPARTACALPILAALGLLAVSRYFWGLSLIAEVYTPHVAFVAGILLALLRWGERPGIGRLVAHWIADGDPGADVDVWVHGHDANLTVTADGSGNWTADFSAMTDITYLSDGGSTQTDGNGEASAIVTAGQALGEIVGRRPRRHLSVGGRRH